MFATLTCATKSASSTVHDDNPILFWKVKESNDTGSILLAMEVLRVPLATFHASEVDHDGARARRCYSRTYCVATG
jgi:hypothetical protein